MLEAFVDLQPGDAVVQNGATSAVGRAVIQLCRARGVRTLNLMRDRPGWDEDAARLQALGADVVAREADAKAAAAAAGLPAPALGLNCVGGSSALAVSKLVRCACATSTEGSCQRRCFPPSMHRSHSQPPASIPPKTTLSTPQARRHRRHVRRDGAAAADAARVAAHL